MAKTFTVKVDGVTYRVIESRIVVRDESGEFSHPTLHVKLRPANLTVDGEYNPSDVHFIVEYQRNSLTGRDVSPSDLKAPATGYMDSRKRWGSTYAAKIEIESRMDIHTEPFRFNYKDKVREAVAKRMAKVIEERNLGYVEPNCQARLHVLALENLGIIVERHYAGAFGTKRIEYAGDVPEDYYANRRAEDEAKAS